MDGFNQLTLIFSCWSYRPYDRDLALIAKCKKRNEPNDWYQAVEKAKRTNPFIANVNKQEDILSFKDLQGHIVQKNSG